MAMGQSRDEYWNGDIFAAFDYAEAYRLKQKAANENAWLNGLYVYDAVASILSAMFAKRGESTKPYAERPFDIYDDVKEVSQKEKEAEKLKAEIWMQRLCEYGKNWGSKTQCQRE